MSSRRAYGTVTLISGLAMVGGAIIILARPWQYVMWQRLVDFLDHHALVAALTVAGIAGVTTGIIILFWDRRGRPTQLPQTPKLLTDRAIGVLTVLVAAVGLITMVVLLQVANSAPSVKQAELRIEAIKYGLGSVAAAGAVAGLLLAFRRQRLAERAQSHTQIDATERRVTELYTKAIEQLGSAEAPVRLGALYALERLAQDNPSHRQTIVNVICAYLRMSYSSHAADQAVSRSRTGPRRGTPSQSARTPGGLIRPSKLAASEESQVRLAAQEILTTHVRRPAYLTPSQAAVLEPDPHERFWPNIDLNLTGAILVDWNMLRGHVQRAIFEDVTFLNYTTFDGTTFARRATFDRAIFSGSTSFERACFARDARFASATFHDHADFRKVNFSSKGALFAGASFAKHVYFSESVFNGNVWFGQITFAQGANFNNVTFDGDALFGDIPSRKLWFTSATVTARENRSDSWPRGWSVVPVPGDPSLGVLMSRDQVADPETTLTEPKLYVDPRIKA